MTKAIIFDMDGVIVDSEPIHFESHREALAEFGFELSQEEYLDFGVATGDSFLYKNIAKKYPGKTISVKKIHARKKAIYKELAKTRLRPRENIVELLSHFNDTYKLAIASSGEKEITIFTLNKFNILDYFDAIVTRDDIKEPKPAPDAYLKAIKKLNFPKEECIAIEDSETGLNSAKAAGIRCIAAPCAFTKNQNFFKADFIVKSLGEITEEMITGAPHF